MSTARLAGRSAFSLLIVFASIVRSAPVAIDRDDSLIAVVTHKAGVAAALAHEHLVVAKGGVLTLDLDLERPLEASFSLEISVSGLQVDRADPSARWGPRLVELGLLAEIPKSVSAGDREKISKAMLGPKQLDSASFGSIRLQTTGLADRLQQLPSLPSPEEFPFLVSFEVEIHGRVLTRQAVARLSHDSGAIEIEAVAELTFRDFGIQPYSAMFGAIRNAETFHLYLFLVGRMASPPIG